MSNIKLKSSIIFLSVTALIIVYLIVKRKIFRGKYFSAYSLIGLALLIPVIVSSIIAYIKIWLLIKD